MLIYHSRNDQGFRSFHDFKNKRKNVKKEYKSLNNRKYCVNQSEALGEKSQKKSRKQKKKISKKNIKFLEGLGLKVKQNIDQ